MKKLEQLLTYNTDCKGIPIDIGDFGERVREYGYFLKDVGRGFSPFLLGRGRDFYPDMNFGVPFTMNAEKQEWYTQRGKAYEKLEQLYREDLLEEVTRKINTAIHVERNTTRK